MVGLIWKGQENKRSIRYLILGNARDMLSKYTLSMTYIFHSATVVCLLAWHLLEPLRNRKITDLLKKGKQGRGKKRKRKKRDKRIDKK
jgi:hypothetical protein